MTDHKKKATAATAPTTPLTEFIMPAPVLLVATAAELLVVPEVEPVRTVVPDDGESVT